MSAIEQANFRLQAGSELVVVVPYSTERCSATLKVVSGAGGLEPRVDVLGAPVIVDVSYNLPPGITFTVFTWSNANIRIEGSKQLVQNCFRSTTHPFARSIVEYHCLIHNARLLADKQGLFGPMVLICGQNDTEKHAISRTLSSYAARTGWAPQFVDLDCGMGQLLSTPGTVAACVSECPMTLDEDTSTGPLSVAFFVGSTEPQVKGVSGEWNMFAPYVHYCRLLLSCVSERIARHKGGAGGSSGAIIVLPELRGSNGLLFVVDIIRQFNISHILCVGDDFLFCGLHERIPRLREHMASRVGGDIRLDKLSGSPHFPSPDTRTERLSSIMERYFFGGGAVDLQPSEINRRYANIEILLLKEANGQAVVSPVEQDALEGVVGCVGSLFESSAIHEKGALSLAPFALARVQGIDANGVSLLVSTHSVIPERLTMIVGAFRWVTS
ncbi:hypothetical protein, conserved [Trypanosoma brucei gambiense DAL972]|uniref:Uncharacterized protein n=1 Tax=Trypanosoma brucei gambiense (strain MHOM/CI/86/DAL972) TaxID=679716 RepID=C9ZKC3_TRYB9|nr:hypothetical protein, conserved [Trypanosoma brucei gambiense DAL972]CBH09887.1 hypothetical protein, conserved [Trypanosoma brucei gambiense DAL972]|eukprot:XP_011772180.1 hypothetical protein, conserved [Trypanosoma brucei gambiense DAL972]